MGAAPGGQTSSEWLNNQPEAYSGRHVPMPCGLEPVPLTLEKFGQPLKISSFANRESFWVLLNPQRVHLEYTQKVLMLFPLLSNRWLIKHSGNGIHHRYASLVLRLLSCLDITTNSKTSVGPTPSTDTCSTPQPIASVTTILPTKRRTQKRLLTVRDAVVPNGDDSKSNSSGKNGNIALNL